VQPANHQFNSALGAALGGHGYKASRQAFDPKLWILLPEKWEETFRHLG
jgi:hypothetical protein